jgi:NhaP-type Na+/H+ or K+/H+ antiporter
MSIIILVLGLTVFIAHFLVYLFKKTGVPDVLILMVAGIILGPLTQVVTPGDFGQVGKVMTTIALIVILFESGVNLKLDTLFSALGQTLILTLVTFAFTGAVVAGIMHLFGGLPWPLAIMTGAILGGTSSAVVIPLVNGLGMSQKPGTVLNLESGLTDVLCIVGAVGIGKAALSGGGNIDNTVILTSILLSFGGALLLGIGAGFFWALIMGRMRMISNTIFTTVAYVFVIYGTAEYFKISGAIAALAFGVTIANAGRIRLHVGSTLFEVGEVAAVDRTVFAEAVFLLKTFFFIYLGLSLQFQNLSSVLLALLIVAPVYAGRFLIVRGLASRSFSKRDASLMTVMVPKGLAAAVLAMLPAEYGFPEEQANTVLYTVFMVVLVSIVLTAIMVILIEKSDVRKFYYRVFAPFAEVPVCECGAIRIDASAADSDVSPAPPLPGPPDPPSTSNPE